MPLGRVHQLLCVACRVAVMTEYPYPERRCGYTTTALRAEDKKRVHVSCTNDPGNEDCETGVHYDRFVFIRFGEQGRLRAGKQGQVG
jgi:hypothetical protein